MIITLLALVPPQVLVPVQAAVDIRRSASHLETSDLNGDGVVDVSLLLQARPATGQRPELRVILSSGPGSYVEPARLTLGTSLFITDHVLTDYDGDGDTDAVALAIDGNTQRGALYSWRNRGDGTFEAPVLFAGGGSAPGGILGFTAGDLQGDGIDDVLLAVDDATGVRVDWLPGPTAPGSIAVPLLAGTGQPGVSMVLELADLDDDGNQDFAIGIGTNVLWATGDGLGGLALVPGGALTAPYPVRRIQPADQNDDGRTDLVLSTLESVIIWIPDPFWVPPLTGGHPPLIPVLQESFETCVVLGSAAGPTGPCIQLVARDARLIDVDDDGDQDLVYVAEARFDQFVVLESLGGGVYAVEAAQLSQIGFGEPITEVLGVDLDLDGTTEVLVADDSGTVDIAAQVAGSAGLDIRRSGSVVSRVDVSRGASVVDVDGDGLLDIAVEGSSVNRVVSFRQRADGAFGSGRTTLDELRDKAEINGAWIDLGADGVEDFISGVAVGPFRVPEARIFNGDGAGGFSVGDLIPAPSGIVDLDLMYGIDMDGDGDEDLAFLDQARGTFGWYEQSPAGDLTFRASSSPGPLFAYNSTRVAFGDFNADGWSDVATNARQPGAVGAESLLRVHLAIPGGGFASPQPLATYLFGNPAWTSTGLFAMDMNADGALDLVRSGVAFGHPDSTVEAFFGDGLGGFAPAATILVTSADPRAVADLDGDTFADVLGRSQPNASGGTSLFWFRGDGAGGFLDPERVASDGSEVLDAEVADIDEDGDLDLIVLYTESNQIDLIELKALGDIGVPYCAGAVPNSTGSVGALGASGSARVADGTMELTATLLPPGVFGLLFTGTAPLSVPIANSIGTLCVGGQLGRFVQPGQIQSTGAAGAITLAVDPRALPAGGGVVSAAPGETRYFQVWHRDITTAGSQTSNLTAAVRVLMR